MKIALNNRNVILQRLGIGAADCSWCCFLHNWDLCRITQLRDDTILCRTVKTFDCYKLYDIFNL